MLNRLMGIMPNASEHGFMIDHMLEFVHWFMLLLFVGWSSFFFVALFRFRQSRSPKADYHGVKSKVTTHVEFGVVLVEAVLLLGFALPLWARRSSDFPKADAMRIRVIGEQFAWNFHYQGPDGKYGRQKIELIDTSNALGLDPTDPAGRDDITTRNELHLLLNKPVILEITSKDVIHSLSLQAMRIGQDAIPGVTTPSWFTPVKTGNYEIICGQLCGLGHYNMRAAMIVDTKEDFEAWTKEMVELNAPAAPAESETQMSPAQPSGAVPPPPRVEPHGSSPTTPQPSEQPLEATIQPGPTEGKPASAEPSPSPGEPRR